MITVATALTENALTRIAAGAPMNFAGAELFEIYAEGQGFAARLVFSRGDSRDDSLIMIMDSGTGSVLPESLRNYQLPTFTRMLNFTQRARTYPITLPRGWGQWKHDNLLAFFALPGALQRSDRWTVEVNPTGESDVIFWATSPSDEQQLLAKFRPDSEKRDELRRAWVANFADGMAALTGPDSVNGALDVHLAPAPQVQGITKYRTFRQWLPDLTASQREFVDAPVAQAVRLRGPAGSGKTLTLAIKAVKEATEARREGKPVQILFATHSWSVAGEVDQLLTALSEEGVMREINILPLVSIAQETMPEGMLPNDLHLIGDDSLTGKTTQLAEIENVLAQFRDGDWITYRAACSEDFRRRVDSDHDADRRGMAWDLLIEFGCVLGADGIFPGINADKRYLKLQRAPWMMFLDTPADKRAVYALYSMYHKSLEERGLLTTDQLLSDFLNYLDGFTWNHRRRSEGYDLIFVDEFHLFNKLEQQILRFLSREVASYPRIFMALDPRQSPWDVYFGSSDAASTSEPELPGEELESVTTIDIPTVHRSSPQVLDLIKHIHLDYPNLNLDSDWGYSISQVESLAAPGPRPSLFLSETFGEEETAIYNAVSEIYPRTHSGAQVALVILDEDRYSRYRGLIERLGSSGKFSVVLISSRDDVNTIRYHRRGIVVGPAEYLAGLQFDTVLIAGLHDTSGGAANLGVRKRGALSLLYLAVSRASREVRFFANDDLGGVPEVLSRASDEGVLGIFRT